MKSYDSFLQAEHDRAFAEGPICRHCLHADGSHYDGSDHAPGSFYWPCDECETCPGYEPRDSHEDDPTDGDV